MFPHIHSKYGNFAFKLISDTCDDLDGRTFSGAIRPDVTYYLPGVYAQVDALQDVFSGVLFF
jgi:hypothetical protein